MAKYKSRVQVGDTAEATKKIQNALAKVDLYGVVCGSLRRGKKLVGDVDIAVKPKSQELDMVEIYRKGLRAVLKLEETANAELLTKIDSKIKKKFQVLVNNVQCDIYLSEVENFGAMMLFLTGSHLFNIIIRGKAKQQGYKLNQYGLWLNDEIIAGRTEVQIFNALGFEYLPPEKREFTKGARPCSKVFTKIMI